jgi:pimeloyl-ACP methyl ester carboxylesterase
MGHQVFVPSLTGLGERAHLFSGTINLDTHIGDVCGLIEAEGLEEFDLVGHSYGGMVITGVADRFAARIRTLTYLDAFLPENGQSALDLLGAGSGDGQPYHGRRTRAASRCRLLPVTRPACRNICAIT